MISPGKISRAAFKKPSEGVNPPSLNAAHNSIRPTPASAQANTESNRSTQTSTTRFIFQAHTSNDPPSTKSPRESRLTERSRDFQNRDIASRSITHHHQPFRPLNTAQKGGTALLPCTAHELQMIPKPPRCLFPCLIWTLASCLSILQLSHQSLLPSTNQIRFAGGDRRYLYVSTKYPWE